MGGDRVDESGAVPAQVDRPRAVNLTLPNGNAGRQVTLKQGGRRGS